ncbi:hypothetical protein BC834DRAFT_1031828, partial [Gloeopeniophorella convolvens]
MSVRSPPPRAPRASLPASKSRRTSEVYVLVPSSPYAIGTSKPTATLKADDALPPPTPLRAHNMPSTSAFSNSIKRKRSEANLSDAEQRAPETKTKRPRLSASRAKAQKTKKANEVPSNATPDFPNGFFYCHQCNKKRDNLVGLYCTFKTKTGGTLARCKAKYCRPCLKNRYGQDLDAIKGRGVSLQPKEIVGHDKTQGYIFKCPRCDGNCNCRGCRKAAGLEPTGNLTLAAKKSGADSVAVMLTGDAKMTGILPGKGRQIPDPPKKPKEPKVMKQPKPVAEAVAPKHKRAYIRKAKPLPQVTWTPVPVPPSFTLERALPRIAIREFVLRFGTLLDMSRAHLEELEEIGGRRPHEFDDDGESDTEQEIDVEMGWVSETCVRGILLGLLGLLAGSQLQLGGTRGKIALQEATQEIKASRANLARMWSALAELRAELEKEDLFEIFPDPLPPPQHTKVHTTRSGALNGTGMHVTSTAQLVPVIMPLIEMVLETQAVREELDEGAKEAKERAKEEKERAREVRDKWEETRKAGSVDKAARAEHKRSIAALEQAHRVTLHAHAPRFTPLGTDHDGRTYIALTPSVAERDAASALLAGDAKKGGKA